MSMKTRKRLQTHPRRQLVDEDTILRWGREYQSRGHLEGGFGGDVDECIRQIHDNDLATFEEPTVVVSRWPAFWHTRLGRLLTWSRIVKRPSICGRTCGCTPTTGCWGEGRGRTGMPKENT